MVHRAGPRDRLMKQLEFFSFAVRHRKCVHQPAPLLESVFTSFDSLHHTWMNHMFSSCLVQYFCVEALLGTFSLCLFVVAYYKRTCKNIVEPLKARSSVSWMNENVFSAIVRVRSRLHHLSSSSDDWYNKLTMMSIIALCDISYKALVKARRAKSFMNPFPATASCRNLPRKDYSCQVIFRRGGGKWGRKICNRSKHTLIYMAKKGIKGLCYGGSNGIFYGFAKKNKGVDGSKTFRNLCNRSQLSKQHVYGCRVDVERHSSSRGLRCVCDGMWKNPQFNRCRALILIDFFISASCLSSKFIFCQQQRRRKWVSEDKAKKTQQKEEKKILFSWINNKRKIINIWQSSAQGGLCVAWESG